MDRKELLEHKLLMFEEREKVIDELLEIQNMKDEATRKYCNAMASLNKINETEEKYVFDFQLKGRTKKRQKQLRKLRLKNMYPCIRCKTIYPIEKMVKDNERRNGYKTLCLKCKKEL